MKIRTLNTKEIFDAKLSKEIWNAFGKYISNKMIDGQAI